MGGRPSTDVANELDGVAEQAGIDLGVLRGFDVRTLVMLSSPAGEVEPARCWLMAEVLYLDGLEATIGGHDGSDSLVKARALFELVRPRGGMLIGLPEARDRIDEIDQMLDGGRPWVSEVEAADDPDREDDGPTGLPRRRRVRSRRVRVRTPAGELTPA